MSQPSFGVRARVVAVAVLVAASTTGCGITHTPLEVALGDAASATGSASLTIRALDEGDITSAVASTAVDDATREISKASSGAAEYRAADGPERALQEKALPVVERAVHHLHQAQDDQTKPGARARLAKALSRDHDQLDQLSTRAGELG